jgi:predicted membrane GTPase involved in stress response
MLIELIKLVSSLKNIENPRISDNEVCVTNNNNKKVYGGMCINIHELFYRINEYFKNTHKVNIITDYLDDKWYCTAIESGKLIPCLGYINENEIINVTSDKEDMKSILKQYEFLYDKYVKVDI